ncbi:MAG: hypothetical protein JXQ85_06375 [Cognatishimia sp.]|uniref:hypothetical protein n=1 Tax=Cognatishimia sp. TaxID=2211648 RepID=UPI003B8C4ACE
MPTKFFSLPEKRLVFACLYGHVTPEDLIDWDLENRLQGLAATDINVLIDLSQSAGTDMTFEDINAIFGRLERHYEPRNQKLKLILFAPDDVTFGMSRILQSLSGSSEHIEVQVFRHTTLLDEILPEIDDSFQNIRTLAQCNCSDPTTEKKSSGT